MQENYEDGSKGEIKIVDWEELADEIKKSLSKKDVKSVTVVKDIIGFKPVKITEEKNSTLGDILKESQEKS